MDPTATLHDALKHHLLGEHEEAAQHATNLIEWYESGGFPPTGWSWLVALGVAQIIKRAAA